MKIEEEVEKVLSDESIFPVDSLHSNKEIKENNDMLNKYLYNIQIKNNELK